MPESKGKSTVSFLKSLYNDPFRWQIVKSVSIFALGVYIAVEIANAEPEPGQAVA